MNRFFIKIHSNTSFNFGLALCLVISGSLFSFHVAVQWRNKRFYDRTGSFQWTEWRRNWNQSEYCRRLLAIIFTSTRNSTPDFCPQFLFSILRKLSPRNEFASNSLFVNHATLQCYDELLVPCRISCGRPVKGIHLYLLRYIKKTSFYNCQLPIRNQDTIHAVYKFE